MKWQSGRRGSNMEDRRASSGGRGLAIGGVGGIVILIIGFLMGGDPSAILNQIQTGGEGNGTTTEFQETEEEKSLLDFADVINASTQDVWTALFKENGQTYPVPKLVVYREGTETGGCGYGQSAVGPFYCPGDQSLYLDLEFNNQLTNRFGAKGEFALAYVIAHEVGHHVQNVLGVLSKTRQLSGN